MGWALKGDTLNYMKDEPSTQPAGYDSEGRPLYYHPPTQKTARKRGSLVTSKPEAYEGHNFNPRLRTQYANEPDLVHASRPVEPKVSDISDELRRRHEESVNQFPFLNLSEGEFVVLRIKRHPIGLLIPVILTAVSIVILVSFALLVSDYYARVDATSYGGYELPPQGIIIAGLLLLALLSAVIGGAAIWIYQKNQFFLTNESVIQEIQHGLFSHHEQTVSLGSIEDASYKRRGILQHLFNYGNMRLSTEGEETTYRFAFVEDPKRQVAIVNNAVEAFKNGRPVGD